ncbi:MAG: helix-turn-helix domain-containing protein [Alistipes sp.]
MRHKNADHRLLVENAGKWGLLTEAGEYDSVIVSARPFFTPELKNAHRPTVAYSGLYIAQAHLFKGQFDSTKVYIEKINQYANAMSKDITWQMIYYNLNALFHIKANLDYPEAIRYFNQALELVRTQNNPINETVLLCNIASLYFIRQDTTGCSYAKEAYQVSRKTDNAYARCFAAIYMAKMYLFSSDAERSLGYIKMADNIVVHKNMDYMKSTVHLLYAEYNILTDNLAAADRCYVKSLSYNSSASPEATIEVYCSYGNFLMSTGRFQDAEVIFKKALSLSEIHHDKDHLHTILFNLGNVYKQTGQKDSTIKYYNLFHNALDNSILSTRNERRINVVEQELKAEHQRKSQKSRSKKIILYSLSVLSAFGLALFLIHLKKKRAQTNLDKANKEIEFIKDSQLLGKIRELLEKEKIYRQNDISLEKLAEILGTNRSYISKVINSHLGMNFHSYINMLRINEAISILEDPQNDMPVKAIAGHLGYNFLPVFYVAFEKRTGTTPLKYHAKHKK